MYQDFKLYFMSAREPVRTHSEPSSWWMVGRKAFSSMALSIAGNEWLNNIRLTMHNSEALGEDGIN